MGRFCAARPRHAAGGTRPATCAASCARCGLLRRAAAASAAAVAAAATAAAAEAAASAAGRLPEVALEAAAGASAAAATTTARRRLSWVRASAGRARQRSSGCIRQQRRQVETCRLCMAVTDSGARAQSPASLCTPARARRCASWPTRRRVLSRAAPPARSAAPHAAPAAARCTRPALSPATLATPAPGSTTPRHCLARRCAAVAACRTSAQQPPRAQP